MFSKMFNRSPSKKRCYHYSYLLAFDLLPPFLKKDVDYEQGEKKRGEDSSCERMKVRVDKKDCLKRKGACPSPSTRI